MPDVSEVVSGSTLDQDDAAFPAYPVSHLVWMGLSSGVEHLDLFTSALRATRTSRPAGYFILARAGLVGAAMPCGRSTKIRFSGADVGCAWRTRTTGRWWGRHTRMRTLMPEARDAFDRQIEVTAKRIRELV